MKNNVLNKYRALFKKERDGGLEVSLGFMEDTPYLTIKSDREHEVIQNTRVFVEWHEPEPFSADEEDYDELF